MISASHGPCWRGRSASASGELDSDGLRGAPAASAAAKIRLAASLYMTIGHVFPSGEVSQ